MKPVRVKKQKLKGVNKTQKQRLEEVINMLFSNSTRHMPVQEVVSKYVTYKNHFKTMLRCLLSIGEITKEYEKNIQQLLSLYISEYKKYFSVDHNDVLSNCDETTLDKFYTAYEDFKTSEYLQWVTRIAHRVKESQIIGKKGVTSKSFREVCIDCQNSTITLNIFTNIVEGVTINYDYARSFHEGIQIPKDKKIVLLDNIRDLYLIGKKIYKLTIQPDLPLDEIFNELINGLNSYKPKVRNADKLFTLLHNKSELFKKNFGLYYRRMVQYKSPIELFTSFLGDVVNDKDIQDPTLLLQCKTLINELNRSFAAMPQAKQDKNFGKVKSLMDFITEYIDKYQDIGDKEKPEDIDETIKQYEKKFLVKECT